MSFKEELEKILRSEFYVNEHDNCDDSCSKKWHSDEAYKRALTSIINLVDKEVEAARKEEWAKIHTKYQKGTVKGQYTILEAVRRVGKNTKFRVECLNCHGVMFRYSNKFKLPHRDCPAYYKKSQLKQSQTEGGE